MSEAMEHFVIAATALPDKDDDASLRTMLEPLVQAQRERRPAGSCDPLPGLLEAARSLSELVAVTGERANLGAWCGPDGTFIGSGSLETCGAGTHGYHPQ